MAGIAGVIGKIQRKEAVARLEEMLRSMSYEPFYSQGFYANEELGLYVGWVVRPDSFCDCMPVKSEDGKTTLILHGEVFTSDERLDALRWAGHRVSDGDASHLIHLYDALGDGFFEELNGTFCGVLVNATTKKVQLFNDRLGFEKLYCCDDPESGAFYFSSETKALLRVVPRVRQFDPDGLTQFLSYGCTFNQTTLYKGVSVLPPASVWEFDWNSVRKRTYFRPEDWQIDPAIGVESFQARFRESFRRVLPRYFSGRLRPGLSLTGGWDTRMIMASHGAEPSTLPCYTFAGFSGDTVDVQQARKVAAVGCQEYAVLRLQSDFLTNFAEHAEKTVYVSDGNGSACLSHEMYLNALARGIAGVRITGNFGSEVLRGVSTFKEIPLRSEWFQMELKSEIAQCKEQWKTRQETNEARFAIFNEIPWKLATTFRLANSQLPVRTPFLDNEILKLACVCPTTVLRKSTLPISLTRKENPNLLMIPTDRGESGENCLLGGILRRTLYSITFKLDYLLCEGTPDFLSLIVDATRMQRVLPLRHRYLDYRRWFRGPLRGYVEGMLGDGNNFVSGLVGRKAVDRVLRDNSSGVRNELPDIEALLTLELINRCLLRVRSDVYRQTIPAAID